MEPFVAPGWSKDYSLVGVKIEHLYHTALEDHNFDTSTSQKRIKYYMDMLNAGSAIHGPPIVDPHRTGYHIIKGAHRLVAAYQCGYRCRIPVMIERGTYCQS
jgi:hypothetical protein